MEFKDYYRILGVQPDADKEAIKTAYRKLARKYHPDVSSDKDAEHRFKEVSEAYEVLSNSERRAEYDQIRQYGGSPGSAPGGDAGAGFGESFDAGGSAQADSDFSDFFESVFGRSGFGQQTGGFGRQRRGFGGPEDFQSTRGQDVETEMPVFLEDTLSDESKTVEYSLPHYSRNGRLPDISKTLRVKIPAGVSDGERIRLKGQGAPGVGDGPAGDLYLRIRLVPHPLFDVLGRDLSITVPVAPWEAALGTRVTVPTMTGKINLTVAPGSQTGQRLRIRGKGLPLKKKRGAEQAFGDLYAVLKVVMPARSDAEMLKLWEQMREKADFDPRREWELT